jgi:hypothetical protein
LRRTALVVLGWAALVFATLLVPTRVTAQLDVGRRALESADFQRAIRAFDRAERVEALDREGLVSLYEGRIIARFAVGSRSRARRDLQVLAELDPAHTFPVEVPPEVGEALAAAVAEAGGGLSASLAWSDTDGASVLRVEVQRDVAELVRGVRVHTRLGDGAWSSTEEREVRVAHAPGEAVAAYVELVGERDVVLAREGTAQSPILHGELPAAPIVEAPEEAIFEPPSRGDDVALAVGLGVGGMVVIAVAVIVGVVVGTQTSDRTQPTAPIVVGF